MPGLKLEVEKLEDVEEAQRPLYVEKEGGGGFQLAVEGMENIGALKRSTEHERAEHGKTKAELKKIKDAQAAIDEKARKAADEAALKSGDLEAYRKSAEKQRADDLAAKDAEYQPKLLKLDGTVRRLLVSDVATRVASELAIKGSEGPLAKLISDRLAVEERDGEHVTVVRGLDGKPSALTVDDLKKEILSDKALAPLLAAGKGSGGGAGGAKGGGAAGAKSVSRLAFDAMAPAEKQAFVRAKGTVTD